MNHETRRLLYALPILGGFLAWGWLINAFLHPPTPVSGDPLDMAFGILEDFFFTVQLLLMGLVTLLVTVLCQIPFFMHLAAHNRQFSLSDGRAVVQFLVLGPIGATIYYFEHIWPRHLYGASIRKTS